MKKESFTIKVPQEIKIDILEEDLKIKLRGPLGFSKISYSKNYKIKFEKNNLICYTFYSNKKYKDTNFKKFCFNLQNIIKGLFTGFFIKINLVGIGFRFLNYKKNILDMRLGFCHNISIDIPKTIKVFLQSPTQVVLQGSDLVVLTQVASLIKKKRLPDSYKGKGIFYSQELFKKKI
jgi:large subunit ribosomal protein L6